MVYSDTVGRTQIYLGSDELEALAASAGSWRGRSFTGGEYVDSVRGDLAERLSRLGLE